MNLTNSTIKQIIFHGWINSPVSEQQPQVKPVTSAKKIDLLYPLRHWIEQIEVSDRNFAHWICDKIPAQCPFARKITLFGRTLVTIPPLCKLNPFYEELMGLRFRALCYLADQCGEDISAYC